VSAGVAASLQANWSQEATRRGTAVRRICLLGGFEFSRMGEPVQLPMSAQKLVAFLALRRRPVTRLHVAGVLWLDSSQHHASANLRSVIWRLHQCDQRVICATNTHVWLDLDVSVDVREMEAIGSRLSGDAVPVADSDVEAACMCGDLLPDWYDEWIGVERERLRSLRLHTLELMSERLALQGQFRRAVETGLAAVSAEPLRESARRALIRAHLSEGNRAQAYREFQLYSELVRRELDLEPSAELEALVTRIRA
jgi:DNA-binding SARP family transcriptional activator